MKLLALTLIFAAACALPLVAQQSRSGSDEAAALRRAGALAWEMSERHHEFSDRRIARRITPEAVARLTDATADNLARLRDGLAKVHPSLTPDSRFAMDLARFLERWPDRDAFREDLLLPVGGGRAASDISSLAMQLTDTRRRWRTPFPFFRP
jgi:hypothetical protein